MKFKVRPMALTMVLVVVLCVMVANYLAVPALAAYSSCGDGNCHCS